MTVSNIDAAVRASHAQRHLAYESLRNALVLQRIPAGERLREPAWSRRLGVNRGALREALARLHAEGLVSEGERGGYFVPHLAPSEVAEIVCARETIEMAAGEQAVIARRNRPEFLCELLTACDDLEWMVERGYTSELGEADQLFHTRLVAVGGNKRLALLHRSLPQPVPSCDLVTCPRSPEAARMLEQHRAIAAALGEGHIELFRQTLHRHYQTLLPPEA